MNNQRVKTILSRNSTLERIKYFDGDYEEDSTSSGTKKYHYIHAPTGLVGIFVREGSADTLYHVLTDHLGSLNGVINAETDSVTYYSYNAWGVARDPDDWTSEFDGELFAGRGFTGHEHLAEFDLINMNGRVYDPILARFLSPDPIVQFPGAANGYNRYSYVMNNPLIFTDPSGYRPAALFEEEGRLRSSGGGGGGWNHFGWINQWGHAQGTESEWTIKRTNYLAAMRSLKNSKYGGHWNPSMSSPYFYNMGESFARAFQDVSETVLGEDGLGNQEVLVENNLTGYTYSKKVPFFNITGSYYNHEYFLSGVEAYGDMKFVMGLIAGKLDNSALFPAAYSWEINGSLDATGAASISPIGMLLILRGQDGVSFTNFRSKGLGFAIGNPTASAQIVKNRYHYFGDIQNFSLENTFYSRSWDIELTAGMFGVVAGSNVTIMFNNRFPGDFLIGVGAHAGVGTSGVSVTGTIQETDKWW